MMHSRTTGRPVPPPLGAAALTTLASLVVLAAVLLLAVPPLLDLRRRVVAGEALGAVPLEVLLAALAGATLAGCGMWLAAATVATAVEVVTGASSALARALTPACVRRVVVVCCGLAVSGAGTMPGASADPHSGADTPAARTSTSAASALVGLPLPDRAVGAAAATDRREPGVSPTATGHQPAAATRPARPGPGVVDPPARTGPRAAAAPTRRHRVRPGDSLWSIADSMLPAAAPVAQVDATWRRIYRANRPVIGSDPDLIVPGTTLRLPGPALKKTSDDDPRRAGTAADHPTTPRKDAS